MKRFMFALCTMCASLFVGCDSGDKPDPTPPKPIVVESGVVTNHVVYADNTEGKGSLRFATTDSWNSSVTDVATGAVPDWVTISPDKGTGVGSYTVNIALDENVSGADRSAQIKIMCAGENVTVNVTQKKDVEFPEPDYALVKQMDYKFETNNIVLKDIVSTMKYDDKKRITEVKNVSTVGSQYEEMVTYSYNNNTLTITTVSDNKPVAWSDGVMTATLNSAKDIVSLVDSRDLEHSATYDKGFIKRASFKKEVKESHGTDYYRNKEYGNITSAMTYVGKGNNAPPMAKDYLEVTYAITKNEVTNLNFAWIISRDEVTKVKMLGMLGFFGTRQTHLPVKALFGSGDRYVPGSTTEVEFNYTYEFDTEGRLTKVTALSDQNKETYILSY